MKKHKFKAGDVVYSLTIHGIMQFYFVEESGECLKLCERQGEFKGMWRIKEKEVHLTPEACAQALVDEFYLTNPKP
jgi:hypothetical protein